MRAFEILLESPLAELADKLPGLAKHDYDAIDLLMRRVANKHHLTDKALHSLFVKKFKQTPGDWIKDKLTEDRAELDLDDEVRRFAEWAGRRLHIQHLPEIELSQDTRDAQDNHHTGGHVEGSGQIWVYAKNRNLVDILRTVAHELTHVRQGELGMIKPGDSYPGSPIELLADMVAGKLIKIYGESRHYIFQ